MIVLLGLTTVLCMALVEGLRQLPLAPVLKRAQCTARRALWVLRARAVSEHWKERALLAYARTLLLASLTLAALLVGLAAVAALLVWLADQWRPGFSAFLLSPLGLTLSLLLALSYAAVRRQRGQDAPR